MQEENLFRGTEHTGVKWWGKNISTFQAAVMLFQVTARGSWLLPRAEMQNLYTLQNAEMSWECQWPGSGCHSASSHQLRHRECELQSPFQSVALDWLGIPIFQQAIRQSLFTSAGLGTCRHSLPAGEAPSEPLQPQEGRCPSSAWVNCFCTPWWLREYCD